MTPPQRSWSRSSNAAAGCWTAPAGTMSCLAPVGTAASYATSGSAGSECWPASDPSARTVSGDGCPVHRPATHGTPPALKRGPDIPQSRRLTLLTSDRAATHRRLPLLPFPVCHWAPADSCPPEPRTASQKVECLPNSAGPGSPPEHHPPFQVDSHHASRSHVLAARRERSAASGNQRSGITAVGPTLI